MNVWKEWATYRKQLNSADCPPYILTMSPAELDKWLSRFVLEVRRRDGNVYPPNTLYQLCCGLLRHIRECEPSLDIFKDPKFVSFQKTLDAEMKRLKKTPGSRKAPKRAEPISDSEEDMLWRKGVLGTHSPQVLVDTMVYMAGLYFALRSGEEHRRLMFSDVELVEKPGTVPFLRYTESVSKNNPGGLKHRKCNTKQVCHYTNTECPEHCFVEIYKVYCSHCPQDVTAFYLAPIVNPKGTVWCKKQAIGANTLSTTVKRLCLNAGVGGYKTNHSLRVTNATRLFQNGTDEQLIMERTGHRSTDGVRVYKHSSEEQQALLSKILNREKSSLQLLPPSAFNEKENEPPHEKKSESDHVSSAGQSCASSVSNVSFSDCTGVTINLHFGSNN